MKFTEAVRKYAAEEAISEEEALKRGMEEKSKVVCAPKVDPSAMRV